MENLKIPISPVINKPVGFEWSFIVAMVFAVVFGLILAAGIISTYYIYKEDSIAKPHFNLERSGANYFCSLTKE